MSDEITEREARILEAYGPLEMTRIIAAMADELQWIAAFADMRSQDESKVFARVNRGPFALFATAQQPQQFPQHHHQGSRRVKTSREINER